MVDMLSQGVQSCSAPTGRAVFWRCLAACALVFTSDLFFNGALGTAPGGVEGSAGITAARDVSCLVGVAAFLALWALGMRGSHLLRSPGSTVGAAVLAGAGQALALAGQAWAAPGPSWRGRARRG